MGKLNIENKPLFLHFSHQHPLELNKLTENTNINTTTSCAGCGLAVLSGRDFLICKTCGFALHLLCSHLPNKLHHPSHQNHHLNLLSCGDAVFHCKACARSGTGFSYNCHACGVAFHALCTILPPWLTSQAHFHPLKLHFSPPYHGTDAFHCDVCGTPGSNHWLYRCDQCKYDAHLGCAIASRNNSAGSPPNNYYGAVQEGQIVFSDGSSSSNQSTDVSK